MICQWTHRYFNGRQNLPESDAETPDGLALEAVALGGTSPVPHTRAAPVLHVLGRRGNECICVGSISLVRSLADHVAVEVAHWLAESDRADDEGDEEQRVDGGHDKEAEVGKGPVITDADHDVEGSNASLRVSVTIPVGMIWARHLQH